ncbi:MAG TPA: hypothetical protein VMZ01_03620 [Aestuariivirga sp.]|nr:hypothetical protein [Aestuariivirga sp.]
MKSATAKITVVLFVVLACGGQTSLPFTPATVPIDNKLVRVALSAGVPGVVTKPHVHATNRVMIYFDAGTNKITYQDGKVSPETFRAGDVQWNDAMGTHVAEIIATGPVNIAHLELKNAPAPGVKFPANDPLKLDPVHYKLEIDNNQVRVLRLRLRQGEKTPLHAQPFERLLVPLTPARLKVSDAKGAAKTVTYGKADLQWLAPGEEAEENLADRPYEALIVEFKK